MLRTGSFSATELMQSCLERISAREPVVKAWAAFDADAAIDSAKYADVVMARADVVAGPLLGIPIGIKDIFDVANMPTAGGTDAYPTRIAERDAASVARLRAAGAIVLGKTVTTAFAMGDAGPTTNPW